MQRFELALPFVLEVGGRGIVTSCDGATARRESKGRQGPKEKNVSGTWIGEKRKDAEQAGSPSSAETRRLHNAEETDPPVLRRGVRPAGSRAGGRQHLTGGAHRTSRSEAPLESYATLRHLGGWRPRPRQDSEAKLGRPWLVVEIGSESWERRRRMFIENSNAIHAMALVGVDDGGAPIFVGQGATSGSHRSAPAPISANNSRSGAFACTCSRRFRSSHRTRWTHAARARSSPSRSGSRSAFRSCRRGRESPDRARLGWNLTSRSRSTHWRSARRSRAASCPSKGVCRTKKRRPTRERGRRLRLGPAPAGVYPTSAPMEIS